MATLARHGDVVKKVGRLIAADGFQMLRTSLWDSAIVLSGSHAMNDAEFEHAVQLLRSTFSNARLN